MGELETKEIYTLSTIVDPRSWLSGFSKENRVKARNILIEKVKGAMSIPSSTSSASTSSTPSCSTVEETWEQAAKRRNMEKQAQVK